MGAAFDQTIRSKSRRTSLGLGLVFSHDHTDRPDHRRQGVGLGPGTRAQPRPVEVGHVSEFVRNIACHGDLVGRAIVDCTTVGSGTGTRAQPPTFDGRVGRCDRAKSRSAAQLGSVAILIESFGRKQPPWSPKKNCASCCTSSRFDHQIALGCSVTHDE